MQLTNKQELGLKEALIRYANGDKFVTIAGYAGTGKSTLVRFIIDALGIEEDKVAYACFTGKAAEVLRQKGCKNAMTLHKLLYDSVPKPNGGFFRIPKVPLEYKIVVVDEISMAPKSMLEMLLEHNIFAIFLGDPFQLPQISKDDIHTYLNHPHVFLDEIMRQAAESEIIQLTMKIRAGENIDFGKGREVIIIPKTELVTGHLTWADQIICATNSTRFSLNNQMREILGYSGLPQSGERMICLRNYWDDLSENGDLALVNGMTGKIENPFITFRMAPPYIKMRNHKMDIVCGNFISDDGSKFNSINMDKQMIETGEYSLDWRESYALGKMINRIGDIRPKEFAFGYAITGHKAQGSEWSQVLVIEENFPFEKKEHARWLYTCCTRSSEKLVLVRS